MLSPLYHLQREIDAERERTRGWGLVRASSGGLPETLPRGGELVFGPPGVPEAGP